VPPWEWRRNKELSEGKDHENHLIKNVRGVREENCGIEANRTFTSIPQIDSFSFFLTPETF
jgi:hypothetical protein